MSRRVGRKHRERGYDRGNRTECKLARLAKVVVPMTQTPLRRSSVVSTRTALLFKGARDRFDFEGLLLFCHAADVPIRSGKIPARRPCTFLDCVRKMVLRSAEPEPRPRSAHLTCVSPAKSADPTGTSRYNARVGTIASMTTPPSPEATVNVPPKARIRSRIPVSPRPNFWSGLSPRPLSHTRTRA